jgi:hypothetical protein
MRISITREDSSKSISFLDELINWNARNALILAITKER